MRRPVERSTGHIVGRHAHFAIESSIGWSVRSGGAFCGNTRAIIPLRLIDRLVRAKLEARQIAFRSLNHRKRAAVVVGSVARDLHSTRHRTREAFLRCLTVAGCTMATSATMPGKLGSIDPEQPDPFVSASDRIVSPSVTRQSLTSSVLAGAIKRGRKFESVGVGRDPTNRPIEAATMRTSGAERLFIALPIACRRE